MTKDDFDRLLPLSVPARVAHCPICASVIVIDEVQDWIESPSGHMILGEHATVSVDCVSVPDIDDPDFDDFMRSHWSNPYTDWLPVQQIVAPWLRHWLRKKVLAANVPLA